LRDEVRRPALRDLLHVLVERAGGSMKKTP